MEGLKYIPWDGRTRGENSLIRVSFDGGIQWDPAPTAQFVPFQMMSMLNCYALLSSFSNKTELYLGTQLKNREEALRKSGPFSCAWLPLCWLYRSLTCSPAICWQGSSFCSQLWGSLEVPVSMQQWPLRTWAFLPLHDGSFSIVMTFFVVVQKLDELLFNLLKPFAASHHGRHVRRGRVIFPDFW